MLEKKSFSSKNIKTFIFILLLLAQILNISLQPGPVRVPLPKPIQAPLFENKDTPSKIIDDKKLKPKDLELKEEIIPAIPPSESSREFELDGPLWKIKIKGNNPYTSKELKNILSTCRSESRLESLRACAATLTAKLVKDGYINSRVFILEEPMPGSLEVVEGRISELRISSTNKRVEKYINKKLNYLVGTVLHLPTLESSLFEVKSIPGIGLITGNLGRLGSDPTQAVLELTIDPKPSSWRGEITINNQGNVGTGEWRTSGTFSKQSIFIPDDNFLTYLEVDNDNEKELGALITSSSYSFPLNINWTASGSLGYSTRQMIESRGEAHEISFTALQGTVQLERKLKKSPSNQFSFFAALSTSKNSGFLNNESAPLVLGGGENGILNTGFFRTGINFFGKKDNLNWNGNFYGIQGISAFSSKSQLKNLSTFGIVPGEAKAIGLTTNTSWIINSKSKLNLSGGIQEAFTPLISSMGFSLGNDTGLKGLPGSISSGDSGWMISGELPFNIWSKNNETIELIPFIGKGKVWTDINNSRSEDQVGSGGITFRYNKPTLSIELGLVDSFNTKNNSGTWNKWMLADGLFTKITYRF